MKRFITLLAFAGLVFGAASCIDLDGDYEQHPEYFTFATVNKAEQPDGAAILSTSFISDTDKPLIPSENADVFSKLKNGQRVVIFFDILNGSGSDEKTATIKLYQIDTTVSIAKAYTVEKDEEIKQYGEFKYDVTVSPYYPTMTPKYINIHVGFYGMTPSKHEFSVLYSKETPVVSDKLKLTLAHDAKDDKTGYACHRWLSIPLEDYKEIMDNYSSLLLYVNTIQGGYQSMEFLLGDKE